jgi:hypothetical protein
MNMIPPEEGGVEQAITFTNEHDVPEEAADAISYAEFLQTLVKVPMQFTVCMYVCVCVHMYLLCVCLYVWFCGYMYAHVCVCVNTKHTHTGTMHTHIHTHTYTQVSGLAAGAGVFTVKLVDLVCQYTI